MASAWSWDADRVSVVFGVLDGSTGGVQCGPGVLLAWALSCLETGQESNRTRTGKERGTRPTERVVLLFSL